MIIIGEQIQHLSRNLVKNAPGGDNIPDDGNDDSGGGDNLYPDARSSSTITLKIIQTLSASSFSCPLSRGLSSRFLARFCPQCRGLGEQGGKGFST